MRRGEIIVAVVVVEERRKDGGASCRAMPNDLGRDAVVAVPCCGLANRMRLVVNAHLHATEQRSRMTVVWRPTPICGAAYFDLFDVHPDYDVIDWRAWRKSDFEQECQGPCVRWQRSGTQVATVAHGRQLRKSGQSSEGQAGESCAAATRPIGYSSIFAAVGLKAALPPEVGAPTVFRGCGFRFSKTSAAAPQRCAQLIERLKPRRELRELVAKLLPRDPRVAIGVHLRPPDAEMEAARPDMHWNETSSRAGAGGARHEQTLHSEHPLSESEHRRAAAPPGYHGRRLSQGRESCHSLALYVEMVASELLANPTLSTVYVATGSPLHLSDFTRALDERLGALDGRLGALDGRLGALDGRLGGMEGRLGGMEGRLGGMEGRLGGASDGHLGGGASDGRLGRAAAHTSPRTFAGGPSISPSRGGGLTAVPPRDVR